MVQKYAERSKLASWLNITTDGCGRSDLLDVANNWWVSEGMEVNALLENMITLPASSFVLWVEMSKLHVLVFSETLESSDDTVAKVVKDSRLVTALSTFEEYGELSSDERSKNRALHYTTTEQEDAELEKKNKKLKLNVLREIISVPKISLKCFQDEVEELGHSDNDHESYLKYLLNREGSS
jgi:hypothetical protein